VNYESGILPSRPTVKQKDSENSACHLPVAQPARNARMLHMFKAFFDESSDNTDDFLMAGGTALTPHYDFDFVFFRGWPILAGLGFCKGGAFVFLLGSRAKIVVLFMVISP
jgi:hypothetical protein